MQLLLNHIKSEVRLHLFDYLVLIIASGLFLVLLQIVVYSRFYVFLITLGYSIFYIIWGTYHHTRKCDLHLKNVLEYIIIGFIVILFSVIIFY
ncbi:hypothetical protein AUK04_05110 [Candidatus Roizmanbacteria bacterium CG2_30_33_16]|uniref:Uncharacterized protein n=4 Tax=Candidatus Roizmaniibacteriota TaxID=1752723 RepID=A0A2H0C5C0_9BACT|nr:MAG: hypothetical protein AUK04_05110 [Candidatus Roizmanbacteria bacterium CG2_30_33_16]PIP64518.1 MAG: hypothetical protein COW96_02095 [Candidatus Roizmanbacteria bacterium CG22_combo_CG10-13_8_21_14_all_33_16]PIX70621.1 MAG: hypothetical protein COZ39_04430 [Candidatus Roizmanbacteria bacterium CG_4_10_14_3_um_filter_33_21]PJB87892.1 MAG: hypothetical protein CO083_04580 [Candidatus Roizmanbacteria bacterium CG_4_9_14_0_8_um_filter_34_12]